MITLLHKLGVEEMDTFLVHQYYNDHLAEGIMIMNNRAFILNFQIQYMLAYHPISS